MEQRVGELTEDFERLVGTFTAAGRFSGPSLHFHRRAIDTRRSCRSSEATAGSDEFLELLYAALTAWGMHRMGPGNTKLRDFDEFSTEIRAHATAIASLDDLSLVALPGEQLGSVAEQVWRLVESLTISQADAKVVANTKLLHHFLPELVPPIDRTYTFSFFYGRKSLNIRERDAFMEMFAQFHRVGVAKRRQIERLIDGGWNSSATKVLDNAVVGYAMDALNVEAE